MSEMTRRIQEAARLRQRFHGTPYESAAVAYLKAQIEQARKQPQPKAAT